MTSGDGHCHTETELYALPNYDEPTPDDVADPPLDERARNALLDARTLTQAWLDTLAQAGNPKRRQRMIKLATDSRRLTSQALDILERARLLVKTGA